MPDALPSLNTTQPHYPTIRPVKRHPSWWPSSWPTKVGVIFGTHCNRWLWRIPFSCGSDQDGVSFSASARKHLQMNITARKMLWNFRDCALSHSLVARRWIQFLEKVFQWHLFYISSTAVSPAYLLCDKLPTAWSRREDRADFAACKLVP